VPLGARQPAKALRVTGVVFGFGDRAPAEEPMCQFIAGPRGGWARVRQEKDERRNRVGFASPFLVLFRIADARRRRVGIYRAISGALSQEGKDGVESAIRNSQAPIVVNDRFGVGHCAMLGVTQGRLF
jgi:hypothetical protein